MTTHRIKLSLLAAMSCVCLGPTGSAAALDYDEAISGDLNNTPLGDLGPGRNTILGSVDSTFLPGPDEFTFNVPTGRQLIGATFKASNYLDPSNNSPNVNARLGEPANGGDSSSLASGSLAGNGSFMFAANDPLVPFPYPAADGYSGQVNLSGATGGATADWEMGIITAGPTRNITVDPGAIGSGFDVNEISTSVFNGNNFDGDGFVLNADFGGNKALLFEGAGGFLVRLTLFYEDEPLDKSTIDVKALGIRLIGAAGSEDILLSGSISSQETNTPGLSRLTFDFRGDTSSPPDDYIFSGFEMLGLLPTDANAIVDAEIRFSSEFGSPTAFTVVPEPTSFALLGLGALCVMRRRCA